MKDCVPWICVNGGVCVCARVFMLTVCERQILFCWLNNIIIRCTEPLCVPLNQTVQSDDTRSRKIILIAYIAVETCFSAIIIHTLLFEFQVLCAFFSLSFLSFSLLRTCSFPCLYLQFSQAIHNRIVCLFAVSQNKINRAESLNGLWTGWKRCFKMRTEFSSENMIAIANRHRSFRSTHITISIWMAIYVVDLVTHALFQRAFFAI